MNRFGSASTRLYNDVATVSDIMILKVVIETGLRFRSDKSSFSRVAQVGYHGT
jgi:hypothetical protein